MTKVVIKLAQSKIFQDSVGERLEHYMAEKSSSNSEKRSIYTYPSNGLPELDLKGPNRLN